MSALSALSADRRVPRRCRAARAPDRTSSRLRGGRLRCRFSGRAVPSAAPWQLPATTRHRLRHAATRPRSPGLRRYSQPARRRRGSKR
ncbi:hypothetical protein F3168_09020 [Polymorphobacter fuscus]|uniref:Uncharacterized protein n=1 Tax=Sandarakinorhabdus fusca TaxID=1439888 RepID=A0A7C9KXD0_9SPHN|nr:hypothetical protein F9290_09020 [Polymorphobacter fuscus]MQT17402.1 hypothetical protein [Polymorphobacter fuscus]